ncbi:NAD(P)/FAD-dependent oxidoreductase [Microaceticoccus formicicus]|uniref:NAD(P)/FAD-dependent oxidoreductase n=1 Tax=Microaceticoccus formicicus TaxID=3118105 RepID=UPI003CD03608|nr:FAD-dependent oxidoreductase [Peptoniphilaceae bacterium AMB_02]
MDRTEYLIIGSGISGYSATKVIREKEPDSMITVITRNKDLEKYRSRLSSSAYDNFEEKDLWMQSIDWYYDNDVELILNAEVVKVDTANNTLHLDDMRSIKYCKLLIATGSRIVLPVVDYGDMENVVMIKTPQDLISEEFTNPKNILVIGASVPGIQESILLKQMGKEVSIVEHGDTILYPALNTELSKKIIGDLEELGIKIYIGSEIETVIGEEEIEKIITTKGDSIDVDLLVLNKGIKSNIEFIMGSEIDYDIGIKVNEYLQTSVENIFGAGDCVEFDKQLVGQWDSSLKQGKTAGENMTGGKQRYRYPDEVKIIEIGSKSLFTYGETSSNSNYETVENPKQFMQLFYNSEDKNEDNLIGVAQYGNITDKDKYVEKILDNRRNKI